MNHYRTSYLVVRRDKRRPDLASRMIGPLVVLLAAAVWPAAVFAADATVDAPSNAVVVFIMILLLLGSVTAGLLFASPFRKRLTPSAVEHELEDDAPEATSPRSVYAPLIAAQAAPAKPMPEPPALVELTLSAQPAASTHPMPLQPVPLQHPMPAPVLAKPSPAELSIPAPPPPIQPPPARQQRPVGSPWSTGAPQPDANWQPGRHRTA